MQNLDILICYRKLAVVDDDIANGIVQVSDRLDVSGWIPDPEIENPYIP